MAIKKNQLIYSLFEKLVVKWKHFVNICNNNNNFDAHKDTFHKNSNGKILFFFFFSLSFLSSSFFLTVVSTCRLIVCVIAVKCPWTNETSHH